MKFADGYLTRSYLETYHWGQLIGEEDLHNHIKVMKESLSADVRLPDDRQGRLAP